MMLKTLCFLSLLLAAQSKGCSDVGISDEGRIIVFGDSLSDEGRQTRGIAREAAKYPELAAEVAASLEFRTGLGYKRGWTYTEKKTWPEYLQQKLKTESKCGLDLVSYAVASSKVTSEGSHTLGYDETTGSLVQFPVPPLADQVSQYLADGARPDDVVFFWAGANDVIEALTAANTLSGTYGAIVNALLTNGDTTVFDQVMVGELLGVLSRIRVPQGTDPSLAVYGFINTKVQSLIADYVSNIVSAMGQQVFTLFQAGVTDIHVLGTAPAWLSPYAVIAGLPADFVQLIANSIDGAIQLNLPGITMHYVAQYPGLIAQLSKQPGGMCFYEFCQTPNPVLFGLPICTRAEPLAECLDYGFIDILHAGGDAYKTLGDELFYDLGWNIEAGAEGTGPTAVAPEASSTMDPMMWLPIGIGIGVAVSGVLAVSVNAYRKSKSQDSVQLELETV